MLPRLGLSVRHFLPVPSPIRSRTVIMPTFNLPNTQDKVPVRLVDDLSQDQLLSFPPFRTWLSTLQHSLKTQQNSSHTFHTAPYKLRRIDVQSVDYFGGKRIGFLKLKAEVSNDNGERLPGSVFLRGGSVGMMVRYPWSSPSCMPLLILVVTS